MSLSQNKFAFLLISDKICNTYTPQNEQNFTHHIHLTLKRAKHKNTFNASKLKVKKWRPSVIA